MNVARGASHLRTIFGFLGVLDTHFHAASGAHAVLGGQMDRATFFEPHFKAIRARFQAA